MTAKKKYYPDVDPNPDFPKLEEKILDFWKREGVFKASVDSRPATKDGKNNEFIFYDGPPFANGLPHYGHLLTGFVKDVFARYQTQRGKRVERRFGWDCHGLPAEMGAEKELNISGRQAIMTYGIDKFNEHCRTSVMKYTADWEYYVSRQGRWVDFQNDYKTMDKSYMESVLWAFKQLHDKGLVYEAHRVMPYSWAAETPLSNFETRLDNSYRDRTDKAITVAFELNTRPHGAPDADKYYILAWTTTPWTLPSNLALAVNKDIQYTYIMRDKNCYVLSATCRNKFFSDKDFKDFIFGKDENGEGFHTETSFSQELRGTNLIGLSYHPLFPYFAEHKHAFRILDGSSFVTDTDGTGVVHIAPGFGEEDQKVAEANGIELVVPVDGAGKFTDEIYDLPDLKLKGMNVIEENVEKFKFGEANELITKWLKDKGQLIKVDQIVHTYPHCWRTDKPLIYRAMPSWYVEVTKFRERMVELNQQINWVPEHVRDGLFGNWLANARDWSISRNRFWGTPIPVWRSKSGKIKVFGSIAELEAASGQKITDLHRPYIDNIVINEGGEEFRRVEDVFDCWFESGSMPYAQVHYPFENKDWFETHFPADFITEYVAQTRGWFYTLMVLSTALFDKPPFKNCICHGVVIDEETGLKYSKRLKNYKDPKEVMDQFGADALRWLMISSPVMHGLDLSVDPDGKFIRDMVRLAIKPIWNAYNFFSLYANADGIQAKFATDSTDLMDRYILAKCKHAVETISKSLDAYDSPSAAEAVLRFFDVLNNWYIRRNKERFWKSEVDADKQSAYDTLYTVLHVMCRATASLLPFTLDEIYRGLTGEKSVHLAEFPDVKSESVNLGEMILIEDMDEVRDICNAALGIRNAANIRVRQPLKKLTVYHAMEGWFESDIFENMIKDEVNVKEVDSSTEISAVSTMQLVVNARVVGKKYPDKTKNIMTASKKGEWKILQADENRGVTKVEVAGVTLENIGSNSAHYEFNVALIPKDKRTTMAMRKGTSVVTLDLAITPELEAEGIARDVVRMIQQARKDSGLQVTDRINLGLQTSAAIQKAIDTHKAEIAEQTLAKALGFDAITGGTQFENELDGQKIVITLAKAA